MKKRDKTKRIKCDVCAGRKYYLKPLKATYCKDHWRQIMKEDPR